MVLNSGRSKSKLQLLFEHIFKYPTPSSLNYLWSFGSLAALCLMIQLITGVCLATHYAALSYEAMKKVEHLSRDVNFGTTFRFLHSNVASFFFICLYIHIVRGLFYRSFKHVLAWLTGMIIYILVMATAFLGYVLPWGQMSFWGATVITNIFTAIPDIGNALVEWAWGGFALDSPTLNRFFIIHYLLPFIILLMVYIHLTVLHIDGSTNPTLKLTQNQVDFYPLYFLKDIFVLAIVLTPILAILVWAFSDLLGHPDNYVRANPVSTPPHIVPEWYFLPFYAALRSCPHKMGGIATMFSVIFVFFFLPLNKIETKDPLINSIYKGMVALLILNLIVLGFLGAKNVENIFVAYSMLCTFLHFIIFILMNTPLFYRFIKWCYKMIIWW